MSEEILRALIEMFALIVKQDGGMLKEELDYVADFLEKQLPHKSADDYLTLFLVNSAGFSDKMPPAPPGKPSAKDSVRVLEICSRINQTLTYEQKVVVLIRAFELIDSSGQFTPRRMDIMNTIAEVFRISEPASGLIRYFIENKDIAGFTHSSFITIKNMEPVAGNMSFTAFLRIPDTDLVFLRSFGSGISLLNGMPIKGGKAYPFSKGSSLVSPPSSPLYYSEIHARFHGNGVLTPLSFVADSLSYRFPDGEPAITDVSFTASGGQLIGVLGANGTGKTTLLNLLSGLLVPGSGDIRVNGVSLIRNNDELAGVIGFVPQDDLLIEELSVFDNLFYAATLSLPDKTKEELISVVNRMLSSLGLYDKKELRVGSPLYKKISGGERKRLNIALELIREPAVLFVDEPTSGLSSRDSVNVMDLLHELTGKGKLVITVIHQPSSEIFKGFDRVLILDTAGVVVYYGTPVEAVTHFRTLDSQINGEMGLCPSCGNVNPEVIFDILERKVLDEFGRYTEKRKVTRQEWSDRFRHVCREPDMVEQKTPLPSSPQKPRWFRQTAIFLSRDFSRKIADRQYLVIALLEGPVLGLVLSYLIRYIADPGSSKYIFRENDNIPVYIFMSVIVALFFGLTISAEEIFRDRKILLREHFLHLSRSGYLTAKIIVLLIIFATQVFLYLLVANPLLGIRDLFLSYWLTMFITATCAGMIGLNISSAFRSAISIYVVIPLLMIPMMVLSGAMFPFDKLNRRLGNPEKVPLIAEIMPTRWTYEALMVRQYKDNRYESRFYSMKKELSNADFYSLQRIPRIIAETEKVTGEFKMKGTLPVNNKLRLISNEINVLPLPLSISPFPASDSISPELFTVATGEKLFLWLEQARRAYSAKGNEADRKIDTYINQNRQDLEELYDNYHNDKMEEIMRRLYEKNKILEYRDRYIQNTDPVYQEPKPLHKLDFRAHFMSPVKKFAGLTADTFTFNIILVAASLIILYVLLYYEFLKKVLAFIETLLSQKRGRKMI